MIVAGSGVGEPGSEVSARWFFSLGWIDLSIQRWSVYILLVGYIQNWDSSQQVKRSYAPPSLKEFAGI